MIELNARLHAAGVQNLDFLGIDATKQHVIAEEMKEMGSFCLMTNPKRWIPTPLL